MIPTTALATIEGEKITNVQRLGNLLAASGYFADAREMAQAAVKVLAGEELGIPPIASMMGIHVIKGKVVLSANLIASRIRAHGYDYHFKRFDVTGCVIEFRSKMSSGSRYPLGESSFTIADAQAAGIKSDMYAKYPRNMLFARAISNGARWYMPEIFAGVPVYTPDEMGALTDKDGEISVPEPDEPVSDVAVNGDREFVANVQKSATEPSSKSTFSERLGKFKEQRQRVGDKSYYAVLGGGGYEHANEVVKASIDTQRAIYKALAALPDEADTAMEPELEEVK